MAAVTGAVIAGVGVAGSLYQGHKAGKQAGKAFDQQAAVMSEQTQLAREHLSWARGVYSSWRQEFDPLLQELKQEAMLHRDPDYAAITADSLAAFESAKGQAQRGLQRYGVSPDAGAWGATERRFGVGRATAEVNARQAARRGAESDRFNRMSQLHGQGVGLQQSAMGITSGAFGGGISALGQQAGQFGLRGQHFGDVASGAAQAAFGTDWASIIDNAMRTSKPAGDDHSPTPAPSSGLGWW